MVPQQNQQHAPTILRRKAVEAKTGLSRTTIYDMMRAGTFPIPISLGSNSVGWLEHEVTEWLNTRVAERNRLRKTRRA